MTANYLDKWQAVADSILAVLLKNPARWPETINEHVTSQDMPPGAWQMVYKQAVEMAAGQTDNAPLAPELVAVAAGGSVKLEWILERMAIHDPMAESSFVGQLTAAKKLGTIHRTIEVLKRGAVTMTAAANNGLKYEEPMQNVMRDLQAEQMVTSTAAVSLTDLMEANMAAMEAAPFPLAETGLWLFDRWITTMRPNEFIAQVAPYKMRKTSLMCNVVLHRLRQGDQVNVFSLDETRDDFIYRLEAMLMAEYMWKNGQYDNPLNDINGKTLMMAGKKWRRWDKMLQTAFQYAWDTLSSLGKNCRIYDLQTCRPNTESVTALCRADAMRYGGLDTVFVDHLQSFTGKKLFEVVEEGSADLHALRGELNCRMWLLAQQNEAAIKAEISEHSPNVKGSGGLAAKADTVLISKYNWGVTEGFPRIVRIELNNARNDQSRVTGYMEMHPASGWITPRGKGIKGLKMKDFLQELKDIGTVNIQTEQDKAIGVRQ